MSATADRSGACRQVDRRDRPDAFFVATLHFDDLGAIRAAFVRPAGQACSRDRQMRTLRGAMPTAREIPVVVSHVGGDAIARVEPLWLELHRHHQRVGGDTLGPYVTDAESWTARHSLYRRVLACPPSFALTAERDEALLGYCVVAVTPATQTWLPDTWGTGPWIAEIESLCVTAQARGAGLGSLLLERVDTELAAAGIDDVIIGALNGNDDAIRLYQRRGFRPAMTYLTRLAGRTRPDRA